MEPTIPKNQQAMVKLPRNIELLIDGLTVRVQGNQQCLVRSKTTDDAWYSVELIEDDAGRRYVCTCKGYEIRKSCSHARAIGRWMMGTADVRFREDPDGDA